MLGIGDRSIGKRGRVIKKEMGLKKQRSIVIGGNLKMDGRMALGLFCMKMEMSMRGPGRMGKWMALAYFTIKKRMPTIKVNGNLIS